MINKYYHQWTPFTRQFLLTILLISATFAFFMLGCDSNPAAPENDAEIQVAFDRVEEASSFDSSDDGPQLSLPRGEPEGELPPRYVGVLDTDMASGTFDANGGTLTIHLDGEDIVFVIPEGALTETVEIEIWGQKSNTSEGIVFIYDCSPSPYNFAKPLTVDHPLDKPDGYNAVMLYNSEESRFSPWVFEQMSTVVNGKASFSIDHFSKYGIS
jgi:hypothetical protein